MDKATVTGLILGGVVLLLALLLGQVPLMTLLRPEAILVVFGGTLTAILISFNPQTLLKAKQSLNRCLSKEDFNTKECIDYLTEVSGFVRGEGILALQPLLHAVEIPFLKKGLSLVIDHRSERCIRESLSTEIEVTYRDEMDIARVFESAGGFSPTMGIIGTIIGLIHVVQFFNDPVQLGQGVAGAFSATLYGVSLSNMFLLPMAGKLRQRARDEWFRKTIILEGILSIRAGEHPMILEEKLNAFLNSGDVSMVTVQESNLQPVLMGG